MLKKWEEWKSFPDGSQKNYIKTMEEVWKEKHVNLPFLEFLHLDIQNTEQKSRQHHGQLLWRLVLVEQFWSAPTYL